MIDEYSPIQTNLKPKPSDNFGLGGMSDSGLKSTSNVGVGGGGGGNPVPFNNPLVSESNGSNVEGVEGGALPAGAEGSILRYNGSSWVASGVSLTKGILTNNAASLEWISGVSVNDMIYYNGDGWVRLSAPSSGTHVLGVVEGALQYIATESCEDPP